MLKLISRYLKGPARIFAGLAPLAMLVEVLMDLQQPALMARIVDYGVANRDMAYVLRTGGLMMIYTIIGFAGGAACSIFAANAAVDLGGRLRQGLYDQVQRLSFHEIDELKSSSLITRLTNDVMQIQNMMLMMLRIMVRSPLLVIGSIFMAVLLSPKLSLLFCVVLPLISASIILVIQYSVPLYSRVQARIDQINTVMRENLLGIRVVKSFTLEQHQFERFSAANVELTGESIQAQNVTFLMMPATTLVMNLSVVAVLWFGGHMVQGQKLEIGKIMAFVNYLVQITNSLVMAVNLVMNISRSQASAVRINEVLAVEPSITSPAAAEESAGHDIEFRNVCFRYGAGGDYVLKNLSLSIREGQMIGIIGATGSGKSTLVSLIPRLYDPVAGQVMIGGVDIRKISLSELRQDIGIVMQDSLLFSGSIGSNLRFGDAAADEAALEKASTDAQAIDFIRALPDQFDSQVEQRGRNFSGGQKQRLSIARTLVKKPRILILDDSTSAIDLKTESRLRTALARRAPDQTLIVISQRIPAVMQADQIYVLDHGALVAAGVHRELLACNEIYRSIAVSQLGEEVLNRGDS